MEEEHKCKQEATSFSVQLPSKMSIIKQMLQATIPITVANSLDTLSQLHVAILGTKENTTSRNKPQEEDGNKNVLPKEQPTLEPMLFTMCTGRPPAIVEIEIMGHKLTNTIVEVNVSYINKTY